MTEFSDKQRQKRKRIMSLTRRLILENGYSKTNLEDVATKAGVSKSTIYQLFKNKEGLLIAIIQETVSQLNNIMLSAFEGKKPLREALIEYATKNMRLTHSKRHVALMSAVISEARYSPSVGRHYFNSGPKPVLDVLADYFKEQAKAGILNVGNPRRAAAHFSGLFHWENQLAQLTGTGQQPSATEIENEAVAAVDVFLNGYSA